MPNKHYVEHDISRPAERALLYRSRRGGEAAPNAREPVGEERPPPQPPWPLVGPPARALITKAAETIAAAPYYQRPIIYTDPGDWIAITGTGYGSTFSSYPLWLAHNGVPSLTPFPIAQPFR